MKLVTVTMYVFEGDRMVAAYEDKVHDTLFNVTTLHVPQMLRSIRATLTNAQEITQVIIEQEK